MAENPKLAFLQNALSVNGPTAPVEETALENLVFQRLITAGMTIDSSGNITAPFVTASPNVTGATGTLPVAHGGTGATTLTGLVKGSGTSVMTAVTAPTGTVVGDTDAQVLTNKTIAGASNTLTVRLANDVTGTLPHANGGTDSTHFIVAGPSVDRTYSFPDASTSMLTTNAPVTVAQGGTGLATLTANNVVLGNGTGAPAFVAPSTSGNLLTSNGTTWQSTAPTPALKELWSNSGTDTSGVATNVDTFAVSGLTAKDHLVFYIEVISVTQATSTLTLFNSTDSVALLAFSGGPAAGETQALQLTSTQSQASATSILTRSQGTGTTVGSLGTLNVAAVTQAWTGSWTVALRHAGVTGGGTLQWKWAIYKLAGQ